MAPQEFDPNRSSIAVGGEKKRGILPLLLALLAVLVIVAIVLLVGSCGSDDDATVASTPVASTTAPAATPAAPAAAAGTLRVPTKNLLGADAPSISKHDGQTATGTGVKVLSVTESGSGFFVGTDASDRQYIEFGSKVGTDEASSKLPAVGDTVDLTGPVRPAPKSAGTTLKLNDADAETVAMRGSYINADTVTPAG